MEEVEFGVGLKHWEVFLSYNESFGQRKIPRQKQEVRVFREFLGNC